MALLRIVFLSGLLCICTSPTIGQSVKLGKTVSLDVPALFRQVSLSAEAYTQSNFGAGITISYYHPLSKFPGFRGESFFRFYLAPAHSPDSTKIVTASGVYLQGAAGVTTHTMDVITTPRDPVQGKIAFTNGGWSAGIGWRHFFDPETRIAIDCALLLQNYGIPPERYFEDGKPVLDKWKPLGPGGRIVPRVCVVHRLR